MVTTSNSAAPLSGEYAQWLVDYIRTDYASGIAGARDDWRAFARDWSFDLADVRNVTFWQGDRDDNVKPGNASWLGEHVPNSTLRMLPGEGHMSIALHLPEILEDLLARARNAPSATQTKAHHG